MAEPEENRLNEFFKKNPKMQFPNDVDPNQDMPVFFLILYRLKGAEIDIVVGMN